MARVALLAFLLLTAALHATAKKKTKKESASAPLSKEDRLIQWVEEQGGQVGFRVGSECEGCLRGALATKDYKKHDVIAAVPFNLSIRFDDIKDDDGVVTMGFAAEYARGFLDRMFNDPQFNKTYRLFLDAHPGFGGSLTPEVWPDELIPELQTPELEKMVRLQKQITTEIYEGSYHWRKYEPFNKTVPESKLPRHMFQHWASLLASRYFGFYRDNQSYVTHHLVPIVDMINHSDNPNAVRYDNGTHVLQQALRRIPKGKQIYNNYQPGVIGRPDMSLYIYGFVIDSYPPLLAAVDLPTFDSQSAFEQTPENDRAFEEGGQYASQEEFDRLSLLLKEAEAKTTLAEDERLLAGDSLQDWRYRTVVQFRALRKKALRRALRGIAKALDLEFEEESEREDAAEEPVPEGREEDEEDEEEEAAAEEEGATEQQEHQHEHEWSEEQHEWSEEQHEEQHEWSEEAVQVLLDGFNEGLYDGELSEEEIAAAEARRLRERADEEEERDEL